MPASSHLISARLGRLRAAVAATNVEALVVSHPPNLRYLLGVAASAGLAVVTPAGTAVLADERYREAFAHALAGVPDVALVPVGLGSSYEETLAARLTADGLRVVGVEAGSMTLGRAAAVRGALPRGGPALVETDGLVEALRMVKDPWEQAIFREAGARLTEVAACILPKVLAGQQERDIAWEVEVALRHGGFERPAFETIVASGPNSARPHHRAGTRRLADGDLVVVDFGGVLEGYAVDMTRTVAIGRVPDEHRRWLELVAAAQRAAIARLHPGGAPVADRRRGPAGADRGRTRRAVRPRHGPRFGAGSTRAADDRAPGRQQRTRGGRDGVHRRAWRLRARARAESESKTT